MEKVYILFIEQVQDFAILTQSIDVFNNLQDAKDSWNCFVCDETRFITEHIPDFAIMEDDQEKMLFEAYEDGRFAEAHTVARVEEKEVKQYEKKG